MTAPAPAGTPAPAAGVAARPPSTVARRVLASFAITVVAFAVTLGLGIAAQRRAAEDSVELGRGYVPAAMRIAQLRAAQTTLSTLVDGIPDEREPGSTRILLETLAGARRTMIGETRTALTQTLPAVGSESTRQLARDLAAELDAIDGGLEADPALFDRLFAAIAGGDHDGVNRTIVSLGAVEHDADKRLRVLAGRVGTSIDELSSAARDRELRSIWALAVLAAMTLAVGLVVSLHVRRLLAPLARVTSRAQAVARGDLTPRAVEAGDDEIGQLEGAFETMVMGLARAQELALSNERLAAIGNMAAHVTHEIRNPLSAMGLNVEMLEEELGNDPGADRAEVKSLLAAIQREVQRLEQLSEEYLRVARLPRPRMEAEDVAAVVRDIVDFARPEIVSAGCMVTLTVAPSLPSALFDEAQVRQALLNLLRNAREAMPGGGAIDVGVAAEGMSVVVHVDDRGGGVPEAIRARVFDPFFSTKGEGTGLGLAITRHIVEAHGGTVTCEPRDGGGTRFRIALPIAPAKSVWPAPQA
ncbi:MAG TPA: HAMP domain-containing sensor histidine kinase [Polyangiaceae bacterium]|nr:HAMP domain-containing sensor histidine kinase [Polyangiaceae bacterium]